MNENTTETLPNLSCGLSINVNVQLCRWCTVVPKWSVSVHCIRFVPVKTRNEKKNLFCIPIDSIITCLLVKTHLLI